MWHRNIATCFEWPFCMYTVAIFSGPAEFTITSVNIGPDRDLIGVTYEQVNGYYTLIAMLVLYIDVVCVLTVLCVQ